MPEQSEPESSLTPSQKAVIEEIFQRGWADLEWPFFGLVDRPLNDRGINANSEILGLSPKYIRREGPGPVIAPTEKVRLTINAIDEIEAKNTVIPLFLQVLKYLVAIEKNHQATVDQMEPTVTQDQITDFFCEGGRSRDISEKFAKGMGLFIREEQQIYSGFSRSIVDDKWAATLSPSIRRFQNVEIISAYLERVSTEAPRLGMETELISLQTDNGLSYQEIDPRSVFIVHGRDAAAKRAIADFVEALGLHPITWDEPVESTGSGTPYTGHIVTSAFKLANAVIVLLTPDDIATLHPELLEDRDHEWERKLTGQARPNVLFEAGMAFATHPDRTIVVEIGATRPFSDFEGRNTIRLSPTFESLQSLAKRLENANCPVNKNAGDWQNIERFRNLKALNRTVVNPQTMAKGVENIPVGTRVDVMQVQKEWRLTVSILDRGSKERLIEITNRGTERLNNIYLEIPDEIANWHLITDVLPNYPIDSLEPLEYARFPMILTMGGPVAIRVKIHAETDEGDPYESSSNLSIYG